MSYPQWPEWTAEQWQEAVVNPLTTLGGPTSGNYGHAGGEGGEGNPGGSSSKDAIGLSSTDPTENQEAAAALFAAHPNVIEAVLEFSKGRTTKNMFGLAKALSSPEEAGKFLADKVYGGWNYKQIFSASAMMWKLEDVVTSERKTPLDRVLGSLMDTMREKSQAQLAGKETIRVYRGVIGKYDEKLHTSLESWSTSSGVAKSFARDAESGQSKTLLTMDISVARVWAIAPIGFANAKEDEVLVDGLGLTGVKAERF